MIDPATAMGTRRLLIGALAFALGFLLLHNVFDALAMLASSIEILSRLLNGLSVASFLIALFVCPAGLGVCLGAAGITFFFAAWPAWVRGVLMLCVPVIGAVLAASLLTGNRTSLIERDQTAGFNGGFEVVRNGLPVNWYVYRRPLDAGVAELRMDTLETVEGERSLSFVLYPDSARTTRPGIFQSVGAEQGQVYDVSFSLKARGSAVRLLTRGERPESADDRTAIRETILPDDTATGEWRRFAYTYTVPAPYERIRFELRAVTPGTIWIDDVRIEPRPWTAEDSDPKGG